MKSNSMESKKIKSPAETKKKRFHIVGIGASAGGFESLELFFQNMPVDTGLAFVVIQHLDPNNSGIMPELLQRITPMNVVQIRDNLAVKPNYVYVIPPNKSLSILNGILHLFAPVESRGLRLPIDIFFHSLAEDIENKSIGIILSGMGSDGSLGIKSIKKKNGLVLVQEPSTAKYDAMPQSAIEAVIADVIAPAEDLPEKLLSLLSTKLDAKQDLVIEAAIKSDIDKIIILLREQTGHDFSLYKKATLYRRIERRKGVHQIDKIQNYIRLMQENPKEIEILFKELLIGVTNFFRDVAVWKMLQETILPSIIDKCPARTILRAWVPACSTGEEAYSLAILFKEIIEKQTNDKNISLQIFATDLDSDAIDLARQGLFSKNIIPDVSPERLKRYFSAHGEGYQIKTSIRKMIVFAKQDVIKDPPFTKLDFISCRNMLIYMEPELQQKLITLFNYSLNPGGIMVLGISETPGSQKKGFHELDAKYKIYQRNTTLPPTETMEFPWFFRNSEISKQRKVLPKITVENIQTIADQVILQRFAPACVLVNAKGDIVYITGRTGKYLEPVAGKANWNIHAMAREGLKNELPAVFRKALQNFEPVKLHNIKVGTNGGTQYIDVTVQRLESPEIVRDMIMIVFTDRSVAINEDTVKKRPPKGKASIHEKELELELQRSYVEIRSMSEEMQTSHENLKSTNEELQSTNEELQSTNEELTTSKEEMQSLNEELQTVNIELQSKVNDFLQANDDMKNLLNSTEIATLFLDQELHIRRFTDLVTNVFKIRSSDIGRPFTDLVTNLQYPEMDMNARKVIKTLTTIETAIRTNDDRWFNIRIMPYRTINDRIDGLVITFTDITLAKKLELELKEANEALLKSKINMLKE